MTSSIHKRRDMLILMVVHIGETLGHLVRALAIADELVNREYRVEIAASKAAEWLLGVWPRRYHHHVIRWGFSHNSCNPHRASSFFLGQVVEASAGVLELMKCLSPDIILGFPGIVTSQCARRLGVPHISILHGPYLSPLVCLKDATFEEKRVLDFANDILCGGCMDGIYSYLSHQLGVPELTYGEYLSTESILVPQ